MVPQSRDYFRFARAVLFHFAQTKRIWWSEYNRLMYDVVRREGAFAACEGKRSFPSFEMAAQVGLRGGRDGHKSRAAYKCRICGLFHLGTVDARRRHAKEQLRMKKTERSYA